MILPPNHEEMLRIVLVALAEDIGRGDITSSLTVDEAQRSSFALVAREPMTVSGLNAAQLAFEVVDAATDFLPNIQDGQTVHAGDVLAQVQGDTRSLLTAERVALNLLQRMSGVATLTAHYVSQTQGTHTRILDTRKTMPGLRELDKYAVRCGGGQNHRFRLDDAILIKDNHIAACGGNVAIAVKRAIAGAPANMTIEVECDTLAQVSAAIEAGATMVLLDNMTLDQLHEAVMLATPRHVRTEASGNVSLEAVQAIAGTGVDYISVGKLTHSARAVDIGLDAL